MDQTELYTEFSTTVMLDLILTVQHTGRRVPLSRANAQACLTSWPIA